MKNNTDSDSKHPPRFITFEGGEGAGKTSLIVTLEQAMTSWNIPSIRTREPGGTAFGDFVRSWILKNPDNIRIDPKAELLLFLAARAQHIDEVIMPAIEAGTVVFCDRFNDSTVAYQGVARELGKSLVRTLCDLVCGSVKPDLTFYLDVDPTIGLERSRSTDKEEAAAGKLDRLEAEAIEFHRIVRNGFLEIAKEEPQRFIILDATKSKKEVADEALARLRVLFNLSSQ